MRTTTRLIGALFLSLFTAAAYASPPSTQPASQDEFIAGYASAILERNYHLERTSLIVKDGIITVESKNLSAAEKEGIRESLMEIKGVRFVDFAENVTMPSEVGIADHAVLEPSSGGVQTQLSPHRWTFLSPTNVFDPILADPRWPNFSAAYDRYIGRAQVNGPGQSNRDAGNVSFGDSLSLFQWNPVPPGTLEIGVQAAVFANFDLDLKTVDLINADYFVGPIVAYKQGDFSALFRIFHQSSHLGDNFLLNNPGVTRFELSYEEPHALLSYELFQKTLRLYGGGGYLVDVDPSTLKRGVVEYGVEFFGPPFKHSTVMPVVAVDLQNRQQNNWSTDISARIGLQFQDRSTYGQRMDLMLEYYNGHSPNGQFFLQKIQSLGVGLHFYL